MKRKQILISASLMLFSILTINTSIAGDKSKSQEKNTVHVFEDLPYPFDALEPYIDAQTMNLHYSKHHKGYYTKFLAAIEKYGLDQTPIETIFSNIEKYDDGVKNNGGGYYNHTLFWKNLSPSGGEPSKELLKDIEATFGSFDNFKSEFAKAAKTQFGSGWAWLVLNPNNKLEIGNTPNQDNPLMPTSDIKGTPLIALDVWEHAYYLNYQNKRGDYINAFWNVINWNEINKRYKLSKK